MLFAQLVQLPLLGCSVSHAPGGSKKQTADSGTDATSSTGAGGAATNADSGSGGRGGIVRDASAGNFHDAHDGSPQGDTGSPRSDARPDAMHSDARHDLVDTDGDGFLDPDDPAPNDPTVPGDFSSPDAIIHNAIVQTALDGAHAAGVDITTHTEKTPGDITGYYSFADVAGHFVATGDGTDINRSVAGSEQRYVMFSDLTVDSVYVGVTGGVRYGYGSSAGNLLRGTTSEVSLYSRVASKCTESGSDYSYWGIGISTFTIDAKTGNWMDLKGLFVNVGTKGTLTAACINRIAGNAEKVGGWAVSVGPPVTAVTPGQLKYMCVDDKRGFAPLESWTRGDGQRCQCTTSYVVSCQDY